MSFKVYKGEVQVYDFTMDIPVGWNIMTLYESAGEVCPRCVLQDDDAWIIFVNGNVADEGYEIQESDNIHFVIQDQFLIIIIITKT